MVMMTAGQSTASREVHNTVLESFLLNCVFLMELNITQNRTPDCDKLSKYPTLASVRYLRSFFGR